MGKEGRDAALKFVVLIGVLSFFADFTYEGSRSILGPYLVALRASATAVGAVTGFGDRDPLRHLRGSDDRLLRRARAGGSADLRFRGATVSTTACRIERVSFIASVAHLRFSAQDE